LRMVLTGSVGLDPLAKACDAVRDLNDLDRDTVGPLTEAAGETLFEMHLSGRDIAREAMKHAHWLAGGSPHDIERLAMAVTPRGPVDVSAVENAAVELLKPQRRAELADRARDEFVRRYATLADRVDTLLATVAKDERGVPFEGVVAATLGAHSGVSRGAVEELMWALQDAWLLHIDDTMSVRFQSPLLARWWQRFGPQR